MTSDERKALARAVKIRFSRYYEDALLQVEAERPRDPARVFFLRPSSFPYCGLRRFLDFPDLLKSKGKTMMSPLMLFYVTVGHAFHHIFQEVLGKHGQLYGNWKCRSCGHVKEFSTYSRCKTCDEPRVYDELEVKYRRTLVGHVDGLYYDEETKTYWVIDYKSTSSRQVWKHGQSGKVFPYRDNVAQIKAYVPLLEDEYRIKIAGYMLVYLPRDNPMDAKVISIQPMSRKAKAKERTALDEYVKTWRMMLLVRNKRQFKELYARKLCPTKDYYRRHVHSDLDECPYAGICFDSKRALAVGKEALGEKAYPMLMHAPMKIQKRLGLTLDTDNGGE